MCPTSPPRFPKDVYKRQSVDNAFVNSFLGGYSTGDVLVSFLAAGVFFDSIKRKGYEGEAFRKAHVRACPVSYTHLDVYKRQPGDRSSSRLSVR